MTSRPVLDVSSLPPCAFQARSPLWWGFWGIILIESTMFGLLIAAYFYIRLSMDVWPTPGTSYPGLLLPTIELIVLIVSCWPAYTASQAAIRNDAAGVKRGLVLNLALAIVALVLRIIEWRSFNFNWTASAYGSIVWMILGLHTFDYAGGVLETVVMIAVVFSGRFGDKQRTGVDVDSLTWYFVVAIWVPLYAVVYWMPYVLGAGRT